MKNANKVKPPLKADIKESKLTTHQRVAADKVIKADEIRILNKMLGINDSFSSKK